MIKEAATNFGDLEHWIKNKALPLWLSVGIDPEIKANYEQLNRAGMPSVKSDIRVRVQARQVFVYAFAHYYQWCEQAEQIAQELQNFVERYCRNGESSAPYVFTLDHRYKVIDTRVDLYDCSFFMLANAWYYRAFGDQEALQRAKNIFAFVEAKLSSSMGGWLEGDYPHKIRRQNPHMHLLEAFIALYEATGDEQWLHQAQKIFELFKCYFYCEQTQVVREYFTLDWNKLDGDLGREVEPGHLFEWVWLLRKYSQITATPVNDYANALYQKALRIGLDEIGLVYDTVDAQGGLIKSTKRCWPLTEQIKAHVVQAQAGNQQAKELAKKSIDCLFTYYLNVSSVGGYIDQLGEDNQIINDTIQASTMYHLVVAAREASLLEVI